MQNWPAMNPQVPGSWWSRNWKWFVPTGCLGLLAAALGFVALIVTLVFGAMKSSDAYREALTRARASPAVQQALGTPIEDGLFMGGNIQVSGPSGHADISFPISGPKGKGTVYVVADKSAGQWTFSTLVAEIDATQERLNLLQ